MPVTASSVSLVGIGLIIGCALFLLVITLNKIPDPNSGVSRVILIGLIAGMLMFLWGNIRP